MLRATPALDRARGLVGQLLAEATGQDRRLPTVVAMARRAGVSGLTMWRAVAEARDQGRLSTRPGAGIRALPDTPAAPEQITVQQSPRPSVPGPKWRLVMRDLECDVVTGRYAQSGTLPTMKELAQSHGASYKTLRKATAALLHTGMLAPAPRGFRIRSRPRGAAGRARVLLILHGKPNGAIAATSPRALELLRALERECSTRGLALSPLPFWYEGTEMVGPDGSRELRVSNPDAAATLGYIVWSTGVSTRQLPQFMTALCQQGRPVAILDETEAFDWRPYFVKGTRHRVFRIGMTAGCGAVAGRYLLGLGHRRVAYVALPPPLPRRQGLEEAFAAAGPGRSVSVIEAAAPVPNNPLTDPDRLAAFLSGTDTLTARARRWRYGREETDLLGAAVASSSAAIAQELESASLLSHVTPLVEQALTLPGLSAIVGATDPVALHCLWHLQRLGRKVPAELSAIGFDDSPSAATHRLTSYNFNMPGAAHAAVTHLVNPGPRRQWSGAPDYVEVEGYVAERGSCGKPRRRSGGVIE